MFKCTQNHFLKYELTSITHSILDPIIPKPKMEICSMALIFYCKTNFMMKNSKMGKQAQKIEIFTEISHV